MVLFRSYHIQFLLAQQAHSFRCGPTWTRNTLCRRANDHRGVPVDKISGYGRAVIRRTLLEWATKSQKILPSAAMEDHTF